MGEEELQNKQRSQILQLIPWVIALVFISVLSACFIANCLVTRDNFLHCDKSMRMFSLPGHHPKLTCTEEKSELKGTGSREAKGATWNCCPVGWGAFQSNCYLPFNDNKAWAESERNCAGLGAHLATINTAAEQNFIIQYLDRQFSYFLGLSRENPEAQWQWVDRTPFNPHMVLWHVGGLNNQQKENCVVLVNHQDKWAWNNISCKFEASRICKKPGVVLA